MKSLPPIDPSAAVFTELSATLFNEQILGGRAPSPHYLLEHWVDFTGPEIDYLIQTARTHWAQSNVHYTYREWFTGSYPQSLILYLPTALFRLHLYKLQDEWYYLRDRDRYYRCDQLAGLQACIMQINI